MNNETPIFHWRWQHTIALIVGALLWIPLWYGIGALIYFVFTLK